MEEKKAGRKGKRQKNVNIEYILYSVAPEEEHVGRTCECVSVRGSAL